MTDKLLRNVLLALKPKFNCLRELIKAAHSEGRSVLVRFNNDADGVSAALALSHAWNWMKFLQHNSAVYTLGNALSDLSIYSFEGKAPLVLLVDFGSNVESAEGIRHLVANGAEAAVIDHHPLEAETEHILLISPWVVLGDSSVTSGMLCAELAKGERKNIQHLDTLARISAAGDRSPLMRQTDADKKTAMVFDYLSARGKGRKGIAIYESLMGDKEQLETAYHEAVYKMDEAVQKALGIAKYSESAQGYVLYFPVDKVVQRADYPGRGHLATALLDHFTSKGKKGAIIAYTTNSISFRLSNALSARDIIAHLKSVLPQSIISGGGHARAASIRVQEGQLGIILSEIGKYLSQEKN